MESLLAFFRNATEVFKWWVVVAPWQQALRVRLGRHVTVLGAGIHLRIPFVDVIFMQSVRLRLSNLSVQTVSTKDGKAVTVAGALAYAIGDILRMYQTLHHAEDTIRNIAAAAIAEAVARLAITEVSSDAIERHATALLALDAYGISQAQIRVTDIACVRTFRLIQDTRWYQTGDDLNVDRASA